VTDRWRPGDPVEPLRALLARGGIVAIPTESSYGLGVDPRSEAGVEAVYGLKARERGKPLPVVAADVSQLAALGIAADDPAVRRAARVWPAPLTVLAGLRHPLPASAGERELAVRVPDHPALRHLLHELGTPVTATSANRSGEPALLDPPGVAALLAGADAVIVDGGRLVGGPPSTLAAWRGSRWEVLRPGRFPVDALPRDG
jgi:tRNA threonylcarbamoyl adenosine modification protein (Sua5/YciO/YrdC/YwlC family)